MATSTSVPAWDTVALAKQLQTIASQSQTLMQSFLSQQQNWGQIGMGDASAIGGPFVDLMSKMAADPASVARAQVDLFNDSMVVWQKTAERMLLGRGSEPSPGKSDKRFKHADWTENAMFSFIKESYLVAAKSIPWRKGSRSRHSKEGGLLCAAVCRRHFAVQFHSDQSRGHQQNG